MSLANAVKTKQPNAPVEYQPSFEQRDLGEAVVIQELNDTLAQIRQKVFVDSGHARRSVHAKSHGILKGELQVNEGLPNYLAQGIFAEAKTYPVVMRLSTTPGDMLPDKISTPRGCAIKVVGVQGDRLPGTENDVTQDFVMVNGGPVFQTASLKQFLGNLKLLAKTTDKAEGAKVALSAALRGAEKAVEAVGGSSTMLRSMGGEPPTHILGETFFSQVAMLYGPYMAKMKLVPLSSALQALTGQQLDICSDPMAIRNAVKEYFATQGGEWDLRVQLCTDPDKMPIEDATVVWPEDVSPYVSIARLVMPPQDAWNEARSRAVDDGMSFSPWHALATHRPLGSIMRARKVVYEESARFRAEHNSTPVQEPHDLDNMT